MQNPFLTPKSPSAAQKSLRSDRRYCRWFLLGTCGALLAIGLFNATLDPFWIHRGPLSSYWHPTTRQLSSRVAKGEVAARDAMDVALVGDSRTLYGLDPQHPALTRCGRTYNLGMPATSVEEAAGVMELLVRQNPAPPRVILWIIQPEFLVYDRRPKFHSDYRLSRLNPAQDPLSRWLHSLWSREATMRSIDLLTSRRNREPSVVQGAESSSHFGPLVNFRIFENNCRDLRKLYLSQSEIPTGVEMEAPVGRIFQACAERGIQLEVIIPPSHALYWECLDQIGWTDRVELGKQTLVQLAAVTNKLSDSEHRGSAVRVWDFSGFEGPAAEDIPVEDAPIRWHADPVHFTLPLGDRIISRVMGKTIPDVGFGKVLAPENLDQHLTGWKIDLARFTRHEHQRRQLADGESATVRR